MCISRGLSLAIFKQLYKYIVSKGYNIFPIKETEVSKQIKSGSLDPTQTLFPTTNTVTISLTIFQLRKTKMKKLSKIRNVSNSK